TGPERQSESRSFAAAFLVQIDRIDRGGGEEDAEDLPPVEKGNAEQAGLDPVVERHPYPGRVRHQQTQIDGMEFQTVPLGSNTPRGFFMVTPGGASRSRSLPSVRRVLRYVTSPVPAQSPGLRAPCSRPWAHSGR